MKDFTKAGNSRAKKSPPAAPAPRPTAGTLPPYILVALANAAGCPGKHACKTKTCPGWMPNGVHA